MCVRKFVFRDHECGLYELCDLHYFVKFAKAHNVIEYHTFLGPVKSHNSPLCRYGDPSQIQCSSTMNFISRLDVQFFHNFFPFGGDRKGGLGSERKVRAMKAEKAERFPESTRFEAFRLTLHLSSRLSQPAICNIQPRHSSRTTALATLTTLATELALGLGW